jgi:hypothetical protein
MIRTYRLFKPVIAFFAEEKQIVQIPADTLIKLEIMTGRPGATRSSFWARHPAPIW